TEQSVETTASTEAIFSSNENPTMEDLKRGIDTKKIKPNELGEVLIILYHHIGGEDSLYYRSVSSFRKDLQNLYDRGYRLVSVEDYIHSTYDIPAGTTPVILTFDDGSASHFKVIKDEKGNLLPDPHCAVGIIDAFYKQHPDFGRHAVFYINDGAFGEPQYLEWKLKYLHENGYEIGNHTLSHTALDTLNAEGIRFELGKNANLYSEVYPELKMTSVAYPYGNRPRKEHLAIALNGEYEGLQYEYKIGIIAGWCPVKPLYANATDLAGIYRVQGGINQYQLDWWLNLLDNEPERRFVSDGVSEVISIPKALETELDAGRVAPERLYLYE
ncbi:MAG: polysaccharide deacetylase family protein, partial [Bacillota bacterium]|nr:polysaccharide deacetylase family protein [Bacillota bacterium]